MTMLTYLLSIFLAWSVLLFAKDVVFSKRTKQWPGLLMAILAIPLFALYYNDRPSFEQYALRHVVDPVATLAHGDSGFVSTIVPATLVGGLYLVRIVVYLRLAVKRRRNEIDDKLQNVNDRVSNFFAYTTVAILLSGITVSLFSWGWIGSLSLGAGFALLYMGVIGILADTLVLTAASSELSSVWAKRKLLSLTTAITRTAVWVADLYRAIRPNLRALIAKVNAATGRQRARLKTDEEAGDLKLIGTLHDRENPRVEPS